jgi:hypothetical protein
MDITRLRAEPGASMAGASVVVVTQGRELRRECDGACLNLPNQRTSQRRRPTARIVQLSVIPAQAGTRAASVRSLPRLANFFRVEFLGVCLGLRFCSL